MRQKKGQDFIVSGTAFNSKLEADKAMYQMYADNMTALNQANEQQQIKNIEEAWAKAEHDYAIGVIGSDAELLAKKRQIWNDYGDASLQDHWSYFEDLYKSEKQYNQDCNKTLE